MAMMDILRRAEKTGDYEFMEQTNDRGNEHVVPIPISLDQRVETLRSLISHQVTLQAESARLKGEEDSVAEQIHQHRISLSKVMLDLGIPSPLAVEQSE